MMNDLVTVAEASETYEREKPGMKHRITLHLIARRFGIKSHDLWNFRRSLSLCAKKAKSYQEKKK
jgi:hypothetical protein